jgi:hypothetical protein
MAKYLIIFNILICFILVENYIIIPFDTFIYNPTNNIDINNDFLSLKFSEDIYTNLTLGDPNQTIKVLLRLDQFETIFKEPSYMPSLSNSFRFHKYTSDKFICNETFHLLTINSSSELNAYLHKDMSSKKIMEEKKYMNYTNLNFVYLNKSSDTKFLENDMLQEEIDKILIQNYSMIGLRLRKINDYSPEFIKTLKNLNRINSTIFTFFFNSNKKDDHYGYLIIGDEFKDKEKEFEETNSTYFGFRDGRLSWDFRTIKIYSEPKNKNKDINAYIVNNLVCELYLEKSYFLADNNYKKFIDEAFFDELVEQNVCQYQKLKQISNYGTYVCDSKSKIFLENYNNNFPDLIFKNEKLGELIFTKKDLFVYNEYNKSDTNIYFMIYFSAVYTSKWMLGRPFLEKYRFSFDLDNSEIIYHKKKISDEEEQKDKIINSNDNENTNFPTALKVIIIIALVLIIFFLGFLFHRLITRMPRKKKANELEDGFDYTEKNEKLNKGNVGINNDE